VKSATRDANHCTAGLVSLSGAERNTIIGAPLARVADFTVAGKPLLYADVPAARAVISPEAGIAYTPGDSQSLADAIVTLSTPENFASMQAASRAAGAQFEAKVVHQTVRRLYRTQLGGAFESAEDFFVSSQSGTDVGAPAFSAPRQPAVAGHAPKSEAATRVTDPHFEVVAAPEDDEVAEISADEVEPVQEHSAAETVKQSHTPPPPSEIGRWTAQLFFGYCPPVKP
jgi:hypothetical protein